MPLLSAFLFLEHLVQSLYWKFIGGVGEEVGYFSAF
jgi:hypothetical protein